MKGDIKTDRFVKFEEKELPSMDLDFHGSLNQLGSEHISTIGEINVNKDINIEGTLNVEKMTNNMDEAVLIEVREIMVGLKEMFKRKHWWQFWKPKL